jgi:adenine-specific DNA-methyltransferase
MTHIMTNELQKIKADLIAELDKRIADKIIEQTNADLLKKLITSAETINEAIMIAELGTTYKRTGFHFDKRLEKMTDTIKYFKKNEKLSFITDPNALTHKLIIGDNYDALLNLLIQYRGKIDVIYIDPPYGKDAMGEFAETNYNNAITRDNLLSMLYPRLVLARQLLSDNGVIFCSIDDKNHAYVKGLFDEVFGEGNFVGSITWLKKRKGSFLSKEIISVTEYALVYAKSRPCKLYGGSPDSSESQPIIKRTNSRKILFFKSGVVQTKLVDGHYKAGNYGTGSNSMTLLNDIDVSGGYIVSDFALQGPFIWTQENLEVELKKEGAKVVINTGNFQPRIFKIQDGDASKGLSSLFVGVEHSATNEDGSEEILDIFGKEGLFDYPKPVNYIKYLVKAATFWSKNSIILDFFAGSGTTGQAVLELNKQDGGKRQFILATANEITDTTPNGIVYDVTSKRLKRVMTGECYDGTRNFKWNEKNEPLGDNLDVYDIATVANFEATEGNTPFEVIDETLYGQEKLGVQEKIQWVCEHFEGTQKKLSEE